MEKKLTIGMAHYSDFHGVYFTIQDIIKELVFNGRRDLLAQIEFLIVENNGSDAHAREVKGLAMKHGGLVRVVDLDSKQGTSCAREKIISEATGNFVLVMDCHILLCPVVKTIEQLLLFINYNKDSKDLYTGPLVWDRMNQVYTHFNDEWGDGMWGRWGNGWGCVCESFYFSVIQDGKKAQFVDLVTQERISECGYCARNFPDIDFAGHQSKLLDEGYVRIGYNNGEEPFEVFAQGLGLFMTRKNSWLGFNEDQSGFGGEECYIHEKYRKNGRKTICLPFLKWLHRFSRPEGVQYSVTGEQKLKNYVNEFKELKLDPKPLKDHFVGHLNFSEEFFNELWSGNKNNSNPKPKNSDASSLVSQIETLQKELAKLKGEKCCKKK